MFRGYRRKKTGYSLLAIALTCFMLLSICLPAYAKEANQSMEKITVKVAFCPLDKFFEYDDQGNEYGYGVDYLNELKKYANIEWEYVPVDSWEAIKDMMISGEVDVRMPVSEPAQPSLIYDYTVEPMLSTYHAIMTLKTREDLYYQDYNMISHMKLAAVDNLLDKTGVGDYLESIGVLTNIVFYPDYNSCREALDSGEVDGLISNVMDLTDDLKLLDKFSVTDNYITTLKGNSKYTIINNAMTQMKLKNPSFQTNLYEEYFPERSVEPFTKEESNYIAGKEHLTVAVYEDRRPVSYYNQSTQKFEGIAIELANQLSKNIGIPFEYVPITTDTPQEMLEQVDLVMPVPQMADTEQYFVTSSLCNPNIQMAITAGGEEPEEGDKIGVLSTTPGIGKTIESLNQFEVIEYSNSSDALKALQHKKIKAFANSSYVVNWLLENPRYSDLSVLTYQSLPIDYDLCGHGEENILKSILNKGIYSITEKEKEEIIKNNSTFSMSDLSWKDQLYIYRQQIALVMIFFFAFVLIVLFYNHSRTKYILEIEKSSAQQEKANHAKSEFLARMSHDIRTPLNVIIGMSQLASDNENPKDTDACLDKIKIASEFLLGLINDVLDMEHIESGVMELHYVPYSGNEFKQYIDSVIIPLCLQKNIQFEYTCDGPRDFVIFQDKLRINQIYFNLLSNAVKFTPEGGKVIFHTDIVKKENKVAMDVFISDTGIGMHQEFMAHMFEPFTQENQELKPISQGTGLGLSIVKHICDLMNMTISAESTLGKGTTFHLYGEYDIVDKNDDVLAANQVKPDIGRNNQQTIKDKTFLVCEDHPMNQEIIRRLLEKQKAEVVLCDNGKRGLEAFMKSAPQTYAAILMDIRMPVMDGLEATRQIRRLDRPDAQKIPIIALTANAYEEDVNHCLDAGMNAHLAKPIEPEILYSTLIEKMNEG